MTKKPIIPASLERRLALYDKTTELYVISYDSVALYEFLNRPVEKLVEYLGKFTRDFLCGFFDALGYCTCSLDFRARKLYSVTVGIANTKIRSLKSMAHLLLDLGMPSSIRRTNRKGGKMTIGGNTWTRRRDVYHFGDGFSLGEDVSRPGGLLEPSKGD